MSDWWDACEREPPDDYYSSSRFERFDETGGESVHQNMQ